MQALFFNELRRAGSQAELAGWLNGLTQGLGRQTAALGFLTGTEFRQNEFEGYYESLLHRPADPASLNGWANSSLDLARVRIAFESGREFVSNC